MHHALAYENRRELAQAIGFRRLRPRQTFTVTTVNHGDMEVTFVNHSTDLIDVLTRDGQSAVIDLVELALRTKPVKQSRFRRRR